MVTPQGERRLSRYPVYVRPPSKVEYHVDHSPLVDRMPTVIGDFISRHVYDSKLRTQHPINTLTCCRFVDVEDGEEIKNGVSWVVRAPRTIETRYSC